MKKLIESYRKKQRALSFLLLFVIINNLFFPSVAMALTGGPSQPEVQSFEPIGTSEMVDMFSGDFNYNLPLMDVDGYPINMSYHSGITSDQEASWVGLGWNINPGVINRTMRGVPDDFNGETITKENNIKDNITVGVNAGFGAAVAGWEGLSLNVGFGVNYNNYVGVGVEQSVSLSFNVSKSGKGPLSSSLGLKSSNTEGLSVTPSVSFSSKPNKKARGDQMGGSIGIGTSYNSRAGLKALSISGGISYTTKVNTKRSNNYDIGGGSSSIDFGVETFVPHVNIPMRNSSVMFQAQFGATLFSIDGTLNASGYFSKSKIEQKTQSLSAYGYYYEHNGVDLDDVMLDFNREKDGGEFSVNTPGLPVTNHTYDIFNVNGQGISGAYRLHRSDIGYVFDNSSGSTSDSYALGVEVASGNTAQVGIDVSVTDVNTTSGKWTSDNLLADKVKFRNSGSNLAYEPAYFKMAGEKVADPATNPTGFSSNSMYTKFKTNTALRAQLDQSTSDQFDIKADEKLTDTFDPINSTYSFTPSSNQNAERVPRSQEISYLKVKDKDFMLRPSDLSLNVQPGKGHDDQFAEVSVLQPDGKRYVYGKALFNTVQKEVSFNASGNSVGCTNGMVSYLGTDNSSNNSKGSDNYFSSTTVPAYSHGFLITAVLSTDYVDIDGIKGPSKGDFGDYTLFEYQQNTSIDDQYHNSPFNGNTYGWRTPYNGYTANYNEGIKTKDLDNQGNYVYGQKEVAYLKYIKTKNYVAVFELNDPTIPVEIRLDGKGVPGENGGGPGLATINNQSRYLKTITLYSRPDFDAKVASGSGSSYKPFPLKQVHFEYNYLLCKGADNSSGGKGKLTLKKVYFTYGTSNKAKFSPYEFAYANLNYGELDTGGPTALNPAYHPKSYNKWGYYKPVPGSTCAFNDALTNSEFPYVEQNLIDIDSSPSNYKIAEDDNVAAWTLSKIKLPSGGEIKLKYEADDYAYVQDKQAMEMFKMCGVKTYSDFMLGSNSTPTSPFTPEDMESHGLIQSDFGTESPGSPDVKGIVIKIKNSNRYNSLSSPFSLDDFKELYLKDLKNPDVPVYFREYVKVNNGGNNGYEFVSGYAYIDYSRVQIKGGYAFIPLKPEKLNLGSKLASQPPANPLVLAALKFARIHTPREAFSFAGEPSAALTPKSLILALADASFINTIIQTFEGPERYLYQTKNLGHHIIPGKSWIRLYNPYFDKLGGGSRVKSILISDNWNTMDVNDATSNYGQIFDYTTTQVVNNKTMIISSGVTTYEPMIGADDNPFRMPNFSGTSAAPLAPDTRYYLEEPYGESLFPSPSVGYRKVTMKSVALDASGNIMTNVTNHATGSTVHEFYTAKDYPVIVNRTDMAVKEAKSSLAGQLLKLDVKHYLTASQGFVVELNDMHGKPKANWVYAEGQTSPLSGVQYFYHDNFQTTTTGVRSNGDKLRNDDIPVLDKNGVYRPIQTYVGIEYDMVADFRQEQTVTITAGGQINLYVFFVALPFLIPPVWPTYAKEDARLRTASFTKVINRYGILDQTVAYQDGATIKTNNLLWDAETGEVLLTSTQNEFKDDIYNLNIPAHLAYRGMSPSYENDLIEGSIGVGGIDPFLVTGDEIIATMSSAGPYANTIVKGYVDRSSGGLKIYIGNNNTDEYTHVLHAKVIRSGSRNMQNVSIGAVSFHLHNPLVGLAPGTNFPFAIGTTFGSMNESFGILNASAVQFTDEAKIDCNCYAIPTNPNPYYWGLKGNWKPKQSYLFLTERNQSAPLVTSDPNYTGKVRQDGTYKKFDPFWTTSRISDGGLLGANTTGWTWTNALSIYSVDGQELENKDALNRYSAATFGYNNKLPLSVSNNSQYREVGFDGFEDYNFDACANPRFKFKAAGVKATPTRLRAHTGKNSIKVNGHGGSVELLQSISTCSVSILAPH